MNDKDEELVDKYNNGDSVSLRILIDRYTSHIYNYSFRFVGEFNASDVTQDIFIKVWKNLKNFDENKSSFKTWIFTITRNTIIDFLRKRKIRVFSDLDTEDENFSESLEDESLLPNEILEKLEDEKFLNNLVEKLSDKYKEVLILYYQEEMTFKEIGEMLGKPLNTVKSYHHRAILKLREEVKN
jgi:RNA polymerase sigma-70 factor (ECF subfamily)